MSRKTALVLSGGGAKGAFQCGAEKYAREVKGCYHWDIIAGVSVGALNGAMLAMQKYQRLFEIWNTISNDKVYTGGFNLLSLVSLTLCRTRTRCLFSSFGPQLTFSTTLSTVFLPMRATMNGCKSRADHFQETVC